MDIRDMQVLPNGDVQDLGRLGVLHTASAARR